MICSKSREGTAESSGARRFSNTSVAVKKIIVSNARNGKLLQARHEKQNQTSRNIGQYVHYNSLLTRL